MPSESKNYDLFKELKDPFKELKWSDLQDWAGEIETLEGIEYQEEERVKEIKRTPEGNLVAWVEGTTDYFTEISLNQGKLSSTCTCPAAGDCKHGVAAVLEYLELTEQGEEIPIISEEDLLIKGNRIEHTAVLEAAKAEASEISETHKSGEKPLQDLRKYLEQLTKPELIEILLELAEKTELEAGKQFWIKENKKKD